jgi:molybdate transport system regulatory protein
MEIRCKVWLEREGRMFFGKGRAQLLRSVDEEGSLVKAAKRLNMSYRAAWGKLRASELHLGVKLVEPGTVGRHGLVLTPAGRLMLAEYERLLREAEEFFGGCLERFETALAAGRVLPLKAQEKTPRAGTRGVTTEEA